MLEKLRELLRKHPAATREKEEGADSLLIPRVELPRPEITPPEPPRAARVPDSVKGMSYSDLILLEADGGLSEEQEDYLNSKTGPTDRKGQYPVSSLMRAVKRANR